MVGTTAVEPLVRHLGAKLRQLPVPQTLLWNQNSDGCGAVATMAFLGTSTVFQSTFYYYDEPPAAQMDGGPPKISTMACNAKLDHFADLAINDIFWTSCSYSYSDPAHRSLPPRYNEFRGPVQGLVPIVQSSYWYNSDLMAEELQNLYACGAQGNILTFATNSSIYDYNCVSSGMRELWANSLGLQGGALTTQIGLGCNSTLTATSMVAQVTAGNPDSTIGYTSTEVYDENRDLVRALKVRGLNQNLAYLPDTDLTSRDKINIREGRYTIQGALKLVTSVVVDTNGQQVLDGNGQLQPDNPAAKRMVDWLQGNPVQDVTLQLPFDIIDIYAQSGVVPQCAMRVTKDTDAPLFQSYQPDAPCNCYFQMQATGSTTISGCSACQDSSGCPAGQLCRVHGVGIGKQGFCE
jgi:hypothetical protein